MKNLSLYQITSAFPALMEEEEITFGNKKACKDFLKTLFTLEDAYKAIILNNTDKKTVKYAQNELKEINKELARITIPV